MHGYPGPAPCSVHPTRTEWSLGRGGGRRGESVVRGDMEPHGIVVVSAPHTHTISCHANRECSTFACCARNVHIHIYVRTSI